MAKKFIFKGIDVKEFSQGVFLYFFVMLVDDTSFFVVGRKENFNERINKWRYKKK